MSLYCSGVPSSYSIAPFKRVMSLKEPTLKMSKSHRDPRSRILLTDSALEIDHKIQIALTDSKAGVSYDPLNRPGVSNLLEILAHIDMGGKSSTDLAAEFATSSMRAFKQVVSARVGRSLADIRDKYYDLIQDCNTSYLAQITAKGAYQANDSASKTITSIKEIIGL